MNKTLNILLATMLLITGALITISIREGDILQLGITICYAIGWTAVYIFARHYFRFHVLPGTLPDVKKVGLMVPGPYIIHKRDGMKIDPNAEYFVLRLDEGGKDPHHVHACRIAIRSYAMNIAEHLPLLAKDLLNKYGR